MKVFLADKVSEQVPVLQCVAAGCLPIFPYFHYGSMET